jgi:hypothetical protein
MYFLISGDRYSCQVGEIGFSGPRAYSYEALIIAREGVMDDDEGKLKKPFKFNMPAKLILPLRNALTLILRKSGIEE